MICENQLRICACGVIVVAVEFGPGEVWLWDPTLLQRRWIRSLWPREMVEANGFGWLMGAKHKCCEDGNRPVDAIARMNATRAKGMGLAGDGTFEGPEGQGGELCS